MDGLKKELQKSGSAHLNCSSCGKEQIEFYCRDCKERELCSKCSELMHSHPSRKHHYILKVYAENSEVHTATVEESHDECDYCDGEKLTKLHCEECNDNFCSVCYDFYHKHKNRKNHASTSINRKCICDDPAILKCCDSSCKSQCWFCEDCDKMRHKKQKQNHTRKYVNELKVIKSKSTETDIAKKISSDSNSSFKMAANLHNHSYSYPASNSTCETQMQEISKSRQPVNDQDIASNIVLPHTYDYNTKQDARTDRSFRVKNDENNQYLEQLASSEPTDESIEEAARLHFDHNEHNLTYEKAVLYAELLSMGYNETQAVIGAKVSEDMVHAISNIPDIMICSFCQNEVENTEDLVVLLRCVHRCCKNCAVNYFTVQIQEKSLSIVCPLCKEPSIFGNESVADQYFTDLSSLLQRLLLPDMYGLFVKKLKYRKMEQDPNFFSCGFCFEGFIAKPKFSKITCSNCKKIVCATCKIEWEQEHERMTCEEFMNWRSEKSMKANEIVRILNSSELHCPSCRCLQYQTTFGRTILHFRCISCGYQFCRMCGAQFLAETVGTGFWNAFWSTFTGGTNGNLVISHYRNCFHLLFPKPTGQLQFLLKSTGIPIVQDCADTTPTRRAMKQRGSSHDDKPFEKCPVLIKQEVYGCLATIQCSNVIYEDDCSCGVCSVHYKEYLLHLIIWNKIEPLEILTNREMETILKAAGKKIPKIYFMNAQYTTALAEKIRKKVPLYVGHTTPDESESSEMRTPTSSGKNKKEQNSKRGNGKNQPSTNQGRARWV